MHHNWRALLKKFCTLKVFFIQFFPVALSVIFLLVYAKCIMYFFIMYYVCVLCMCIMYFSKVEKNKQNIHFFCFAEFIDIFPFFWQCQLFDVIFCGNLFIPPVGKHLKNPTILTFSFLG